MNLRLGGLIILLVMITNPSLAQSTYSPDFCEFSITFPQEPYKTQRCDDGNKKCYEQVSFTKVFDAKTTINARVICNEIDQAVKDRYSGEVMEATLRAMTKRSTIDHFETSFREEEKYKQAGLVGQGKTGRTSTFYIAQLWIGEHSAFSVEAELIGEPKDEADKLFSEMLRSVKYQDKQSANLPLPSPSQP